MKTNSEYIETIRELYSALAGEELADGILEETELREAGVSSLMAITLISRQLEVQGHDPSDIDVDWLDLLETFGGLVEVLRSIDAMADHATV